jgi:hypothetical protein
LVLVDTGQAAEAVADLIDALLDHATDDDAAAYRIALHQAAAQVREAAPTAPEAPTA